MESYITNDANVSLLYRIMDHYPLLNQSTDYWLGRTYVDYNTILYCKPEKYSFLGLQYNEKSG